MTSVCRFVEGSIFRKFPRCLVLSPKKKSKNHIIEFNVLCVFNQKASLSSTLRRLGEEIYRPRWLRVMEDGVAGGGGLGLASGAGDSAGDAPRDALFLRSHNQHVRLLSCVIILKTLSQGECSQKNPLLISNSIQIQRLYCP